MSEERSRSELVELLREIVELLMLDEGGRWNFRARAFERAAKAVENSHGRLAHLPVSRLSEMEGIGKSTAEAIREYFKTGTIARLEELRGKYPADFVEVLRIPGIGTKTMFRLRDELNIQSISDLRDAIAAKSIHKLPGMGPDAELRLSQALERLGSKQNRRPIHVVLPVAEQIVTELNALPEVTHAQYAGSLRRLQETIADIDILVISTEHRSVIDYFVNTPRVSQIITEGEKMASVYLEMGIQVDLRIAPADEFGAALLHFSSGRQHNIQLRMRAHDLGFSLNEKSLHPRGGDEVIVSKTEEEIYEKLGMPWIEPAMRQGRGEIRAAINNRLPELTRIEDLQGDLHLHCRKRESIDTSIESLVQGAHELGYSYLAIASHGPGHPQHESSEKQYEALAKAIRAARKRHTNLHIYHVCELSIDQQGELNYSDEARELFDFCIASVHSHYGLSDVQQTDRLIYAMEEPSVRILGHMLGRTIGSQEGIKIHLPPVLEAARENDVAIEVNGQLDRLDAPADIIRKGSDNGNLFVISSDASDAEGMKRAIGYGVTHSHAGWLPRTNVLNAWTKQRVDEWLRQPFD
jgi:DNA polymerase (family 10)